MVMPQKLRTWCGNCGSGYDFEPEKLGFETIHACPAQCGLTTTESKISEQEDLANMFTHSMSLAGRSDSRQKDELPTPAPAHYSVSQHYHHSTHGAGKNGNSVDAEDIPTILAKHNINALHLLPAQLTLFRQASEDQRQRLVQLWQIAPPQPGNSGGWIDWHDSSVEREEERARARYDEKVAVAQPRAEAHVETAVPIHMEDEMDDGRVQPDHVQAEPYMKSGYEILAERDYNRQVQTSYDSAKAVTPTGYAQAVDPVFSGKEWWANFVDPEREQSLELQYGAYEQLRYSNYVRGEDTEML